jgi:dTDP-4-dehydrorhamnose reductase
MMILLFGASGQVGWELQRSLSPVAEVIVCNREQVNLEKGGRVAALIGETKPTMIVNAAAYTAVDKAEIEVDRARRINAESVGIMANEARKHGSMLVHYSSDYIFDGEKDGYYREVDSPNPCSVYGRTKHEGEELIRDSGCRHLIFRTSWVYSLTGQNFAKKIIGMAKDHPELRIINDQYGVPTSAEMIADITAMCLLKLLNGGTSPRQIEETYNIVPTGTTTWHGFAEYLINSLKARGESFCVDRIEPVSMHDFDAPAKRPANSRLSTTKIQHDFKVHLPPWQWHVDRFVKEFQKSQ